MEYVTVDGDEGLRRTSPEPQKKPEKQAVPKNVAGYNIYKYYSQTQGLDIDLPPIRQTSGKVTKPIRRASVPKAVTEIANKEIPKVQIKKTVRERRNYFLERIAMQQDCVNDDELLSGSEQGEVDISKLQDPGGSSDTTTTVTTSTPEVQFTATSAPKYLPLQADETSRLGEQAPASKQ